MLNILTNEFQISGAINKKKLSLILTVPTAGYLTTARLPATPKILGRVLPSIFTSECFNEDKNEFVDECKNTELGHLFEHIFLEYLCIEKINNGANMATFEGVTNWNWKKEPIGTFHININAGQEDDKIIKKAFDKAVCLLKKITIN